MALRRWIAVAVVVLVLVPAIMAASFLRRTARLDVVATVRAAEPMRVEVQSSHRDASGSETTRLVLHDAVGAVQAEVRIPAGDGPFPALVVLGGLRTGKRAVDLVDPALPYAVAALDYAHDGVAKLNGAQMIARLPQLVRDLVRTGVVFRDVARHVAADRRIDPERVFLFGASLGSPLACAVAAAQPAAGLVLLYGFADHRTLVAHRLQPHIDWHPARAAVARFAGWMTSGFDAQRTLPQACGTSILFIGSSEDDAIPGACSDALWNAACPPRERFDLPGGHIDAGRKEVVLQRASEAVRVWLERSRS